MNNERFWKLMDDTWANLRALSNTKGQEYAHSADRLANFKRLAEELNMTPEQVLWVYFTKHKDSIVSYIKPKQTKPVLSEPIEGRIDDAILYLILLKGLICERSRVPETDRAASVVPWNDGDRLQSGGGWNPGPLVRDIGYRIMGRNQVVRADDPRLGDPVPTPDLFDEATGTHPASDGRGNGEAGRGDPDDRHPV